MKAIVSQMAGTVLEFHVQVGDQVHAGQDIATLESMKMQMGVPADQTGIVKELKAQVGDFVNEGDPLVVVE